MTLRRASGGQAVLGCRGQGIGSAFRRSPENRREIDRRPRNSFGQDTNGFREYRWESAGAEQPGTSRSPPSHCGGGLLAEAGPELGRRLYLYAARIIVESFQQLCF